MGSPKRPDQLDTRTPVSTDWLIITPTGGPAYKCAVSSISGGGVTSLNSLTGGLNIVAGSNITVTPSGSNITIAASGGGGGGGPYTINNQTGTSYTFALTDAQNLVTFNNSSTLVAVTIPLNSAVNFPVGTSIDILQLGLAQVVVSAASGVTLNYTPGKNLRARYSGASLIQYALNTWVIVGDTTT